MKILHLLFIVLLFIFILMGALGIFTVYKYYHNDLVPHQVFIHTVYPFELYEVLCAATIFYCILKYRKGQHIAGLYASSVAIVISAAFFILV